MNIFKKIGAALHAAALTATTVISASASTGEQSDVHTVTLETYDDGSGTGITVNNISSKYAECDSVYAEVFFLKMKKENGKLVTDSTNKYSIVARHDLNNPYGLYTIYDSETKQWLNDKEGGSGACGYIYNKSCFYIG